MNNNNKLGNKTKKLTIVKKTYEKPVSATTTKQGIPVLPERKFDPSKPFVKNDKKDTEPKVQTVSPVVNKVDSKKEYKPRYNTHTVRDEASSFKIKLPKKGDLPNIDYVNIVKYSDSDIGRKLSIGQTINLATVFGKAGSMKQLMDYINIIDYPISLLAKSNFTKTDISKVPKKKRPVLNYWAIIAINLINRIKADAELMERLISLPKSVKFTSYEVHKQDDGVGNNLLVFKPNMELHRYCMIVQDIYFMLKEDNKALTKQHKIENLVNKHTYDKTKSVYEGLDFVSIKQ